MRNTTIPDAVENSSTKKHSRSSSDGKIRLKTIIEKKGTVRQKVKIREDRAEEETLEITKEHVEPKEMGSLKRKNKAIRRPTNFTKPNPIQNPGETINTGNRTTILGSTSGNAYKITNYQLGQDNICMLISELESDACYLSQYAGKMATRCAILTTIAVIIVIVFSCASGILSLTSVTLDLDLADYIGGILGLSAGCAELLRSSLSIDDKGSNFKKIQAKSSAIARKARALRGIGLPSHRIEGMINVFRDKLTDLQISLYENTIENNITSKEFADRLMVREMPYYMLDDDEDEGDGIMYNEPEPKRLNRGKRIPLSQISGKDMPDFIKSSRKFSQDEENPIPGDQMQFDAD